MTERGVVQRNRKRGGTLKNWDRHNVCHCYRPGPTERLELLKGHFAAGLTCRQIAAEIGVSRNAVIGKLSRLGLSRDKPPGSERAREETERAPRAFGAAAAIRDAAAGL